MPSDDTSKGASMATTGHYENLDGQPIVRFERTFPYPVAVVWEAVTDPAQLAEWFPTTVEFGDLEVGEEIVFRFAQDAYPAMSGRVIDVQPRRRLVFSWGDDELTFELEPADGGSACRLSFSVALDSADKAARDAAGWDQCLDMLAEVAAGAQPRRPAPAEAWRAYYDDYREQGLPATAPIPE
jgi:uncharacterized protein YndB with AHSA1/START domain